MENKEVNFPEGIKFKQEKNAPDFVIGNISINVDRFIEWLKLNRNNSGYVNLDVKRSKAGNLFMAKDDWEPTPKGSSKESVPSDDSFVGFFQQ